MFDTNPRYDCITISREHFIAVSRGVYSAPPIRGVDMVDTTEVWHGRRIAIISRSY